MSDSLEFQDRLDALDHAVRAAGAEQDGWPEEDQFLASLITITLDGDADALTFASRYRYTTPLGAEAIGEGSACMRPALGDAFTSWGDLLGRNLGGFIKRRDMERAITEIQHYTRRGVANIRTILPSGMALADMKIERLPDLDIEPGD